MSSVPLKVTIVDAAGVQQTFHADRLDLDCGCGCLDIRPGRPAFCRGFEQAVMTLDEGGKITTLKVLHGMASLAQDAIHVLCEEAYPKKTPPLSPLAKPLPDQPPETTTNNTQETHYSI